MSLPLTVAVSNYDRTRPIMDGRVAIEGCDPIHICLEPEEMFHRALHFEEFDVTELSFSNYLTLAAAGNCPYVAIPAFPARKFRHSGVFINRKSGIKTPEDLKGKIVGAPEYQITGVVWVRGFLEDDYGVKAADMRWRWGGLGQAGRTQKVAFTPPEGVELEGIPEGQTLSEMLAAGEIDAIIAPRSPNCFAAGHPDVARLFPNFIDTEKDYYRQSNIFPIMHLVGIHRDTLAANPWLPVSVLKAFEAAKEMAYAECRYDNSPRSTDPWMEAHNAEVRELMGEDFWPYGVDENRKTLDAFLRYHFDQGLADRRLTVEEIFAPATLERSKI